MTVQEKPFLIPDFPHAPPQGLDLTQVPVAWITSYPGGKVPTVQARYRFERLGDDDGYYSESPTDGISANATFQLGVINQSARFYVVGVIDAILETVCASCYDLFDAVVHQDIRELFVLNDPSLYHWAGKEDKRQQDSLLTQAAEEAFTQAGPGGFDYQPTARGSIQELGEDDFYEEVSPQDTLNLLDLVRQLLILSLYDHPHCKRCSVSLKGLLPEEDTDDY
ncbi:MAG: hypothetical protein ACKO37_05320 [Vampirovibrionales bacterium]